MSQDTTLQFDGPLDAEQLDQIYGRDYFHGRGSSYPKKGYRYGHQDWRAWVEFILSIKGKDCRLYDLGCAYGYLVQKALRLGMQAWGVDVSSYALRQEKKLGPCLALARVEALPFPSRSADVACLFDVLEHLTHPETALAEAARIIKHDGVILGATPDPLFFQGHEETHCTERPPSFWLSSLRKLGLAVRYRFSVEAYNFQFIAGFPSESTDALLARFGHDRFDGRSDVITAQRPLEATLREGWGDLTQFGRLSLAGRATIYLLNPEPQPLKVRLRLNLQAKGYATLRIRWNSSVLNEFHPSAAPLEGPFESTEFLLPSGGHHIFIETFPDSVEVLVERVQIEATPESHHVLAWGLPFDLYQRYRTASEIIEILKPSSVLDFGGMLGDQDGHIASSRDVLVPRQKDIEVVSSDLRQCDLPEHLPAATGHSFFKSRTFEMTASLDVLEHIPSEKRAAFLEELDQTSERWILLAAPFASPATQEAEDFLRRGLMAARRFLAEHQRFGLPDKKLVADFYAAKGYHVLSFPGIALEAWLSDQILTQHYFSFDDYRTATLFNSIANRKPAQRREPSYRTFFLISKQELPPAVLSQLREQLLNDPGSEDAQATQSDQVLLHERIAELSKRRRKALLDACFLVNEREKHIQLLSDSVEQLQELNQAPLHRIIRRRLKGEK